jgi:hypothetical protein
MPGKDSFQGSPVPKVASLGTGRGGVVVSLVAHRLNDAVNEGDRRVLTKSYRWPGDWLLLTIGMG